MPVALIIRAPGTNCDAELARAFHLAGAEPDVVHLERVGREPDRIANAEILAFPGGFSFGDDIASGRIFAMKLRTRLYPALRAAAARGTPIIGVCNGFQVLVQAGLLPGPSGAPAGAAASAAASHEWPEIAPCQEVAVTCNAGGRFIDEWVRVRPDPSSACLWTEGLTPADLGLDDEAYDAVMRLPIAHGEGRVAAAPAVLDRLEGAGQVPLRYVDNPNGSERDIAGICDRTGRVFALMPHPERYLDWTRHPFFTRLDAGTRAGETPGLRIFRNAVSAAVPAAESVRT